MVGAFTERLVVERDKVLFHDWCLAVEAAGSKKLLSRQEMTVFGHATHLVIVEMAVRSIIMLVATDVLEKRLADSAPTPLSILAVASKRQLTGNIQGATGRSSRLQSFP